MSSHGINTPKGSTDIISTYLKELVAIALQKSVATIDATAGFFDLGMDSKMTMQLVTTLEEKVGHELYPTLLFEYQNIEDLSLYLLENDKEAFSTIKIIEKPSEVVTKQEQVNETLETTVEGISEYLQDVVGKSLDKSAAEIDTMSGFFDLGMDSKMTMQLVTTLEEKVGHELYPTLLFEYQNIEDLSLYLFENDKQAFAQSNNDTSSVKVTQNIKQDPDVFAEVQTPVVDDIWGDLIATTKTSDIKTEVKAETTYSETVNNEAIAIVGLSGRYPQANTISEFWENLKNGKNCVTEIPTERWDLNEQFDTEKGKQGKSYSKWGGFIEHADKFDPLFFGMSPIAAENMDPQARIFLEETWKTIEDAGYNPAKLSSAYKVGVYAGVFWTDYQLYRLDKNDNSPSSFVSTVANMTSFYLGFNGPSIGLDTQCSSSLTALHLACESIRRKECDVAIAGGVNLSVHASKYPWLSNARYLSDKGKCEAFGEGGNGYVPAEGIGTVLLKKLSDAEKDGDRIYAVIKGNAINHGGKSSGLTVPNLNAQSIVIKDAMEKAGVSAKDYSYVEAHGTGTSLGDPIEIAGLNKAFNNTAGQYCNIGSVKSNIGHAEAAAGIAGLTKIVLQLQHKQIVPSLHSTTLNNNIAFDKTAFTVPQQLQDWTVEPNRKRVAGLSSFGAGGSNAHIIVEEYNNIQRNYKTNAPAIIVLSAKNSERLNEQVENVITYLDNNRNANIYDIAYTLQVGRQAMEERLAFLANDISDLKNTLEDYTQGERTHVRSGNIADTNNTNDFILKGSAGKAYLEAAIQAQEVEALIQLWITGIEIDWSILYSNNNKPNKISLPTYPFARERYWVASATEDFSIGKTKTLHPLVHANESTLAEQKYASILTGEESFLKDHKVENEKILPGVAYLEWAREAGARSLSKTITQLRNVTWLQPIVVASNPETIKINLFEEDKGYGYEIYSPAKSTRDEVIFGQGTLHTESIQQLTPLDIEALKATYNTSKSGIECYEIFNALGFDYGDTFQGIKQLYYNETTALSEITLHADYDYVLQPGILDSALQSILGISLAKDNIVLNLPFSTKKINIYGTLQDAKWCYVRQSKSYKTGDKVIIYDIDIISEEGEVLLQFLDFTTLPIKKSIQPKTLATETATNEEFGLQLYTTAWKNKAIDKTAQDTEAEQIILLAGASVDIGEQLKEHLEQEVVVINEPTEIAYYNKIQELIKPLLGAKQKKAVTLVYKTEDYIDYAFISGLFKTAQLESRKLTTKTVGIETISINTLNDLAEMLKLEQQQLGDEVKYVNGIRTERLVTPVAKSTNASEVSIKDNGVYLITGGSGGLGKLFAAQISKNKSTKLILSGRSTVSRLSETELNALNATYYSCDVTDKKSVETLISSIIETHGKLDGIIHSAGVIADSFLIKKTAEEATKVLQPKINGVKFLDQITRDLKLDFTVYFSSMAAVTGNFGQSDYASANTWLDYYAVYRNTLQEQGKRHGHTLSINWPLWKDGGMKMDAESEKYVKQKWGMSALPTAEGILAFEHLLENKNTQGVVAYGERKKIHQKLVGEEEALIAKIPIKETPELVTKEDVNTSNLSEVIEKEVFALISSILKLDASRINKNKGFGDYGFDSVMMINLVQVLNEKYDGLDLAPTALINYTTIAEFLEFLLEEHEALFKGEQLPINSNTTEAVVIEDTIKPELVPVQISKRHKKAIKTKLKAETKADNTMAIVAMNGRFSAVETEDELWNNTASNVELNLAKESSFSDVSFSQIDLNNTTKDWSVLNLDASEIEQLSSQEKLIFEVLSNAMKHYKIDRKTLSSKSTGVFIAAQEFAEKDHQTLAYLIPNKVSYYLNLKGPSELVNTYCTSSYVAIHRAIQSITSGECKQAIIGGVNLVSQEEMTKAVASDYGSLFSKKGDTKSFSEDAEGFVRSEGVGVIIIKPLVDAEENNDTILGLIKGSSVCHGGKGFSLEAPNAKGLKTAIEDSILKANVPIDTIDYIEAHGIANRMADAIELGAIDAVYKKFSKNPDKKWHIGTSKPVVGHSELASGMASIIKVLKAFEHKTIPGIAGLDTVNSELDPNHSLVLTTEPSYWKNGTHPRRAGLNSYAVGGVNAHLILEEYPKTKTNTPEDDKDAETNVVEVETEAVETKQDTVREAIEAISDEVFKIAKADFDETLSPIDYDFDSIKVIELVNRINDHFDVKVKMGQILGADDFKSMFDVFETIVVNKTNVFEDNLQITEDNLPKHYALSEGQKGLWFIQNATLESTAYNVPVGFSLEEEIEPALIYKAAEYVLAKHPALRVSFYRDEDGEIKQEVHSVSGYLEQDITTLTQDITTEFKTLQALPFSLSENVTKLFIRKEANTNKTHILFLIHHIVFDGSSVTPFVSDFKAQLQLLKTGERPSKVIENRSYFDFIQEEEAYLKSPKSKEDFTFWNEKFSNTIDKIELPYNSEDNTTILNKQEVSIELKGETLLELKQLAKSKKANLSVIMLSVFKVLLYKLTNTEELIVKLPTAGRTNENYSSSIGYYINMMLAKTTVSGKDSFSKVVEKVKTEFLSNIDYAKYPYPKLLTTLETTKGKGESLFPITYVYQNIFNEVLTDTSNTKLSLLEDITQDIVDDYILEVIDLKDSIKVELKCKEGLFTNETITAHLEYYKTIIQEVVKNETQRIEAINIVSPEEEQKLLVAFNTTDTDYPKNKTISQLFKAQVEKTPNAAALVFGEEQLTYKELETRSNQLAFYLASQGVTKGAFVGICMEKSIEMMVSIFGILKAGGAYVPIDPNYPKERINYMLNDSIIIGNKETVKIVLTQEHLKAKALDEMDKAITAVSISNIWTNNTEIINAKTTTIVDITSNDLAYVIYTSGSTGQPKGVMIKHRGVVRLVKNSNYFNFDSNNTILSAGAFSFDATIFEFFGPLLNGAKLVLDKQDNLLNNEVLSTILNKNAVDVMFFTTSWFNQLVDSDTTVFKNLDIVFTGGEKMSPIHVEKLQKANPELQIVNCYGPTENSAFATTKPIRENEKNITIGKPISNDKAYILNTNNKLQPIGVSGELCFAGAGVAHGYLNKPELTQEKFIDNPFGEGKLYKTGDLARWTLDGEIEFLGRIDNQIKLRGFRIELGEIETTLNTLDNILSSSVIIKEHAGSKQLVAYCVLKDSEKSIDAIKVKEELQASLPEYMVPAFILEIEAIPLTANGKVDKKALLNLDVVFSGVRDYVAPRTTTEQELAVIWETILEVTNISVYDDFFELGGHSLLVTKLLSRIQKQFNVNLLLSNVFESSSLEQLAQLINKGAVHKLPEIVANNVEEAPLSFAQQRLWFLDELGQGNRYHIPYLLKIKGTLDINALEKSIHYLVQRHESLRTVFFKNANDNIYQKAIKDFTVEIIKEDVSEYPKIEREAVTKQKYITFFSTPFNLEKGPLFKTILIKVDQDDYVFGLSMHHIISDGWSINIIVKELNEIYNSYVNDSAISLPQLQVKYSDYAIWQKQLLEENTFADELSYWTSHLKGYQDLALPLDYARPKKTSGNGKTITLQLDASIKEKITKSSKALGGTLFTGVLTSIYTLLNKYTGQDDICVGVPVSNRLDKDVEHIIGFFVNTLVNRLEFKDEDTFATLFNAVQKELVASQEHQNIPFDKIVEAVQPEREASITPIFQVMINYASIEERLNLKGTTTSVETLQYDKAKFDLSFDFMDTADNGLMLLLGYNTDLFKETTIQRLLESLELIITVFINTPEEKIKTLNVLSQAEEQKLLIDFNNTATDYPKEKSITALFNLQAQATPNTTAITFEGGTITYKTLEERSNQLAIYLQNLGVKEDTLVGICMDRSIEMMISIFGILKAGGAYVPVDSEYPKERINYILEDSIVNGNTEKDIKLILTQDHLKSTILEKIDDQITAISLAEKWQDNASILNAKGELKSNTKPNNLAYVIYTSGSTGKPKGVMVEHKSVVRLVKNTTYYSFKNNTTLLATGAFSFDATIFEFFGPLLNGGTLVLSSQNTLLNNQLLEKAIEDNKVDVMWFTSSWLNQIVDTDIEVFKTLKTVLSGGERLSPKHISKLKRTYPELQIINGYGPTENTTFSTTHNITEIEGDIPLGKPLSNDNVFIVNKAIKLQPISVSGELCLAGSGLARGYLNRPDLTAEKFIDNPFGKGKLYKTGDLARWNADGNIEYLGRIDNQVKLRGFRIELGEIETNLNNLENIINSTVIIKEHAGSKQLVAYCVLNDKSKSLDILKIKEELHASLPDYMIPNFILEIETLPLTANGKVNRKALLELDVEFNGVRAYVAPKTEVEKQLVSIWEDILEANQIGVYENFFELGGHSLLVTKLLSRINKSFNINLELSKVYETPVLKTLANVIEDEKEEIVEAIEIVQERNNIPLSFAQQRLWFLNELGKGDQYHIPEILKVKGTLDVKLLEQSLNYLINRHESLRTTFHKNEAGKPFQRIAQGQTITLNEEDYSYVASKAKDEMIKERCESFIYKSFNLSQGPLLKAMVLKLEDEMYLLGLNMHHIISDGWSLSIFKKELNQVYSAYLKGEEIVLPELPIQYLDYTVWQQSPSQQENYAKQLQYWKTHLQGYKDVLISADFPRPKMATGNGKRIISTLNANTKKTLLEFNKTSGGTLFTSLLTSVYIVLNKYSGQNDICVGVPVANRGHKDIETLIGFFVNTLVSRIHIKDNDTVLDVFNSVQSELIQGQGHQDVPFDKVVEAVQPERETSITPIFQTMVNYVKMEEDLSLGDTTINIETLDYDKAKFDLSFDFIETKDQGLFLSLAYNTDIYAEETANRLLNSLEYVLSVLVSKSSMQVKTFGILKENEQQQLLNTFNAAESSYDKNKYIHNLFEEQAEKTPHAIALVYKDEEYTYKELNTLSNQFSNYLKTELKVKAGDLVGVKLERNQQLLISLLGVLKTGAAYVPLDVNYPEERINYIENDSNCVLVVDNDTYVTFTNNKKVYSKESLKTQPIKNSLANIIYTSGTTGKPKGVMISHQNMLALAHWAQGEFKESDFNVTYASTSHCFDLSVYEMFFTLSVGKKIRILKNALEIGEYLTKDSKILINTVPSSLRACLDEGYNLSNVSVINLAGEPFPVDLAQRLDLNTIEVRNLYGPSEDTTYSTYYKLSADKTYTTIPIGKPIANTQAYVLDKNYQIQPIGVPGKLYLSGDGISQGYLNKTELTKERFVTNVFNTEALMYDTGDIVKWTTSGQIEYLGREDHQVKIRGFRIELGEIELAIAGYKNVKEVVVIDKDYLGAKQLVAYCIADTEELNVEHLKQYLAEQLPDYMIPNFIYTIEEIPLTPNGKVDRKQLKVKDLEVLDTAKYIAPSTETEQKLAIIWQELLEAKAIGAHDNFFNLGGHSLLVTRLLSRVNKDFNVNLKLSVVFETPVLSTLATVIDKSKTYEYKAIEVIKERTNIPLSFAQQRLWFLSELGQGDQYHIPEILRIKGTLNIKALEQSLNYLVDRHESLRTTFHKDKNGKPYQNIVQDCTIALNKEDYSNLSNAAKTILIKERCTAIIHEPFNLSNGPLLRATVIKLEKEEFLLGLCMHHIISDGWSLNVFIKELNTIYSSYLNGDNALLLELPIQYIDYTVWQQSIFKDSNYKKQLGYWTQHLKGYKDLAMSTDYPRPRIASGKGKRVVSTLDATVKKKLLEFNKTSGGTLFTSLLTSVYIVLNKYSGQNDICIGIPVANRGHKDLESQIGFFVNTIVSRIQFKGEETIQELFNRVQEELIQNQQNQDIPFDQIVDAVQPERETSMTPIFQTMVNYVKMEEGLRLGDTDISIEALEYDKVKFDLSFDFVETIDESLLLTLAYNTDIYSESTATRLLSSVEYILFVLVLESNTQLKVFSILSIAEKQLVLNEFNNTKSDYNKGVSIQSLFVNQVKNTPGATAIICEDRTVSYEELDIASNQLANYLQTNYIIGKGTLIGVKLQRDEKLIICLLAILKTGAAYVPLDINYPDERLNYIEQDSNCTLIIDYDVYEDFETVKENYSTSVDEVLLNPEDNAYIIYTSGTTGKPKGVTITHKNAVALIHWAQEEYNTEQFNTVYAATSHCFDLSIYEMFYTLSIGKTIRVLENALDIANYVTKDEGILINTVPSSIRTLIDEQVDLSNVTVINLAGEPFPVDIAKKLQTINAEVWNLYGPSEDTTYSTYYKLSKTKNYSTIPIGRPIANTKALVLNQHFQLVPQGVVGTLYLSGDGVTKGYLNKPELTKERFIPNPFQANTVMYNTGDLVKWLPDGTLDYLGRQDNQVKVRGYRIELGEIENELNTIQAIKEDVVIVKDYLGSKQLVAYCVLEDGFKLDTQDIKNALSIKLPDYMVPNFINEIKAIPLTPNGKTDRKQLEAITLEVSSTLDYIEASTEAEKQLTKIWKELLELEQIGIHDDFFDLGGHSLLTMQLMQKINEQIKNQNVQLVDLINNTTIHKQGVLIENSNEKEQTKHLVSFNVSKTENVEVVQTIIIPGMPGVVDGYFDVAEAFAKKGDSVYGIQMYGLLEGEESFTTVKEMATHNVEVIKRLSVNNIRLVAHSFGGIVLFEMIKQLLDTSITITEIILLDSFLPEKSLKVIEKTKAFIGTITGMLNIKMSKKQIQELATKTIKKGKIDRANFIHEFVIKKDAKIDKAFFNRLYQLYNNALNVSYKLQGTTKIKATLIKAKQTTTKYNQDWNPYFKTIKIIESSGDHFEMTKQPFTQEWESKL